MAERLPGSKVLDGRWGIERHAIAIPKGREQAMAFVRQFTNQVKSQGVVGAAIARAGLRGATTSAAE
jgi:polar amino acid transport system substrate-binding protein